MYPSEVCDNPYGRGLVATVDLDTGTEVARFAGPVVGYHEVPPDEVRHVLLLEGDRWLIPRTAARYLNHGCDPNCRVGEGLEVVTLRPVRRGEELTIDYISVDAEDYASHQGSYFWDERWDFDCRCGAPDCVGRVRGYRIRQTGEGS